MRGKIRMMDRDWRKKREKILERVLIMMNSRHTGVETNIKAKQRKRWRWFEGEEKL